MKHPPNSAPSSYIKNPEDPIVNFEYPLEFPGNLSEEDTMEIRQLSQYDSNNKAAPDNNMFFEELHNPLSSKGD